MYMGRVPFLFLLVCPFRTQSASALHTCTVFSKTCLECRMSWVWVPPEAAQLKNDCLGWVVFCCLESLLVWLFHVHVCINIQLHVPFTCNLLGYRISNAHTQQICFKLHSLCVGVHIHITSTVNHMHTLCMYKQYKVSFDACLYWFTN